LLYLCTARLAGRRTLSSSTRWSIDITPILSTYVMLRYLDKPNVDMRSVREQLFVRKQDKVIFDFPWRTILKCGILPPIWCSVWRLLKRTSVLPRNTSCGF